MAAGLEVRNLTKIFGQGDESVTAVNNISFSIQEGELFSLLGGSGCGKTTTLRMVAGLEQVTSGSILFSGKDVTRLPSNKRGIGMVFQSYALYPHMTVFENVAYGLRIRRVKKREVKTLVEEALEIVDLPSATFADRRPSELSGGQQQRVALARSLVYDPQLLLFDEPLSNLDAKLKVSMREEVRKVQQRSGITAIYVTHDQEEALAISDRVGVMSEGIIEQVGTPIEIYDTPATAHVADFIGKANLFPAVLTDFDGPHAIAETPSGEIIRGTTWQDACRVNELVTVMIRPERLQMAVSEPVVHGTDEAVPGEMNVIAAKVEKFSYLGNRTRYAIQTQFGADVIVDSVLIVKGASVGSEVAVSFRPSDVLFLPFSEIAQ